MLVALGITAGLVACGDGEPDDDVMVTIQEDCDIEDQEKRDIDCGYYEPGGDGVEWIWFSWVVVGQVKSPPPGWKPPHNIKYPTKTVRVPRKYCAMAPLAPAPPAPRPAAPAPAVRAPAPAQQPGRAPVQAPKAPQYKPPAGTKVNC